MAPVGFPVTTVELTHGVYSLVLVEECLLVLVVPVLLGRRLGAGLELALGGVVLGVWPG